MTSRIDWPRTASGDCSPIAHSTASVMFDLPEPLGPTTTETPGREVQLRAVGEGLEALERDRAQVHQRSVPSSSSTIDRGVVGMQRLQRGPRGLLLGVLLRAPRAAPDLLARDRRDDLERAVVRRPGLAVDGVLDERRAAREALLQRRLEVDRVRQRVRDLRLEGLDDRGGGALVAVVQVARADHRLDHRRQHALGLDERVGALADARGRRRAQPVGHAEALGDGAAGHARHALGADLRQPAGAEALGLQARVEVRRHGEAQHGVAEERQARVGVAAALGPRGVREDLPVQMLGQLLRGVR